MWVCVVVVVEIDRFVCGSLPSKERRRDRLIEVQ